jgi:uncharacterized zinc-type alcohol dehydrogenase-like protein
MITHARAVPSATARFQAIAIERRSLGPRDVLIDIAYTGICHTDVHHVRSELGTSHYPMVPGHEIAGTIAAVGSNVHMFSVGDRAGVGCLVDSCRECQSCRRGLEAYCREGRVLTYNDIGRDGKVTYGGYSENIVVDEAFAVKIPEGMALESAAPLMCAGITTYSPLRHWGAGPGKRVAIVGFGGLGHVGVQIASALGAETTVINRTEEQGDDARRMGADDYRTPSPHMFQELAHSFDLVVSTVPISFDIEAHLNLVDQDGTFVNLGVPETPLSFGAYSLLINRRSIAGSSCGGLPETQEMVDFCMEHGVAAQVEVIEASYIDEAFDRLVAGDVRYRFVIDARTVADHA